MARLEEGEQLKGRRPDDQLPDDSGSRQSQIRDTSTPDQQSRNSKKELDGLHGAGQRLAETHRNLDQKNGSEKNSKMEKNIKYR